MSLSEKSCVPCKGGIPPLSKDEALTLLSEIPDWSLSEDGRQISRKYQFKTFSETLNFVNRVGELAEIEWHHPDISFGWGYCRVNYYSHKIKGLHENDFIMGAKTDALYKQH